MGNKTNQEFVEFLKQEKVEGDPHAEYFDFQGPDSIILDGTFELDFLRALVKFMERKEKKIEEEEPLLGGFWKAAMWTTFAPPLPE
jgi:hypothetical protein